MVIIESKNIFLRNINSTTDNLGEYLSWLRDTDTNKFIVSAKSDYSMCELVDYVNQKNLSDDTLFLGIFMVNSQRLIGTIKLEPIDSKEKFAWLGMLIGSKSDHGKGYGFEALGLILKHAHEELGLKLIYLGVDLENLAARNLYLKHGFKFNSSKLNVMELELDLKFQSIV